MFGEHHENWKSDKKILTQKQAYLAMFKFLEQYWERGKSEEIACILSNMSLSVWADGTPGDPAYIQDWDDAVKAVFAGSP